MHDLTSYAQLYPEMPIELCRFFKMESRESRLIPKTVFEFCSYYKEKYQTADFPQPRVIAAICDSLVNSGVLSIMHRAGADGTNNQYLHVTGVDHITDQLSLYLLNKRIGYIIYGFKAIYEDYKRYVHPVEYISNTNQPSLGTCFSYKGGILTAKHCIEHAKRIAIRGIKGETLGQCKFKLHQNSKMDLVYIKFPVELPDTLLFGKKAEVLDEVMSLGYPIVPGFHNFLTGEGAVVSSRFTTSVGQVAALADDFWIKQQLLLITAKIRGGNSGGPIVAKTGDVIGVAVNLAYGDGNYDEMGYGTVIPISFADEIVNDPHPQDLDVSKIQFVDFVED
jgi:serine protease Do